MKSKKTSASPDVHSQVAVDIHVPNRFVASVVEQELNSFTSYLDKHEYREGTVRHYRACVSAFLGSSHYRVDTTLECQIDSFLGQDYLRTRRDFKNYRASLRAYYTFVTQTPYSKATQDQSLGEIDRSLTVSVALGKPSNGEPKPVPFVRPIASDLFLLGSAKGYPVFLNCR